jgi:hypothetical protein
MTNCKTHGKNPWKDHLIGKALLGLSKGSLFDNIIDSPPCKSVRTYCSVTRADFTRIDMEPPQQCT